MDRVLTYLDGDIVVPLQICLAVQIVLITIVWRMMSRKQSSSDKDKIESKKGKDEQSPVKYDFLRERELKADEHPRWFLPKADRDKSRTHDIPMYIAPSILQMLLKYDIDPTVGFLPKGDPLQRLPRDQYGIWEDLGDDLGDLLCARLGQARDPLSNLPVISIEGLTTNAMMRRAHLLLCLFAHAYVWGGPEPKDVMGFKLMVLIKITIGLAGVLHSERNIDTRAINRPALGSLKIYPRVIFRVATTIVSCGRVIGGHSAEGNGAIETITGEHTGTMFQAVHAKISDLQNWR